MRWARKKRDESGAILIVATAGVVLAVISAALAVDTGRLAQEKRRDQKVADLAALDAVRDLANHQTRAQASAIRNAFPTDAGYTVQSELGTVDANGDFVPGAGDAVRVTVTSPQEAVFLPNRRTVRAVAVARSKKEAGFSIGSNLGTVTSGESPILNRVLGTMFGNQSGINLTLVGYQGLSTADVTLGQLATQIGFGTVNELLAADMTLGQLLSATSTALNNEGDVASATVNTLALAVQNSSTFKLGDFITVAQGSESTALATGINVFQLINSSAQMANKNAFLDAGTTLTVPVAGVGDLSTKLGIKVIEAAQICAPCTEGMSKTTSQVEITLTPTLNAPLLGGALTLRGDFPVKYEAAGATGTMYRIVCSGPGQGIVVGVSTQPVTSSTAAALELFALLKVANADIGPVSAGSAAVTHPPLSFAYASEFTPAAAPKSTPTTPLGLDLTTGQVNVQVLGFLGLGITVDQVKAAVVGVLNPVIDAMSAQLLTPAFGRLGFKVGSADVAALRDAFDPSKCGSPALVR